MGMNLAEYIEYRVDQIIGQTEVLVDNAIQEANRIRNEAVWDVEKMRADERMASMMESDEGIDEEKEIDAVRDAGKRGAAAPE
jgi:hypothetical protein